MQIRLITLTLFASLAISASAEEVPTELLARYVNNDTVVIATVRLEPEHIAQLQGLAASQMVTPVDRAVIEKLKPILEAWGDRRLYVIAGLADMMPGTNGPLMIATAATGEDETQFKAFAEKLQAHFLGGVKPEFAAQVRVVDGKYLLIANKAAFARFDSIKPQPRPELVEKLADLLKENAAVAAVVSPGPDARRVLREMWPQLPPPYSAITGPLLADRVKQITLTAKVPPEWSAELAIHTSDDAAAATLAKTGKQVVEQFSPLIQKQIPMPGFDWPAMIETATPKQRGNAVVLTVSHDNPAIVKAVASLAAAAVGDAREAAQRSQKMNQFKQIALAFHNFHDTQKFFPASAAICDKNGNPLLSWRVAILPFIDEQALFDQFHLDEPWDSEHNMKLLDKMPDLYADSGRPDHDGKTTFQLPVHPESMFPPTEKAMPLKKQFSGKELFLVVGTKIRVNTDGTSNTILVVEVAAKNAVPWTKPADWEVDLADPVAELTQAGRDGFISGYCDGHVQFDEFSIDPDVLRAFLTRAGQELIDRSGGTPKVKK